MCSRASSCLASSGSRMKPSPINLAPSNASCAFLREPEEQLARTLSQVAVDLLDTPFIKNAWPGTVLLLTTLGRSRFPLVRAIAWICLLSRCSRPPEPTWLGQ